VRVRALGAVGGHGAGAGKRAPASHSKRRSRISTMSVPANEFEAPSPTNQAVERRHPAKIKHHECYWLLQLV
jgi:hypothetical protein